MKNWFDIRALEDGEPQLLIEGMIGYWPVVAEEFRWQLDQYEDSDPVEVRIDSLGGDPIAAKSIYSMLVQREGDVTVIIENNCLSAASLIACAGDTVIMHDLGVFMIHEPEIWPDDWMRQDEAQSVVDQVRIVKDQMIDIYASHTGKDDDEIAEMMRETTWMNAEEALEQGFIDEVRTVVPQMEDETDMEMAARAYEIPERILNGRTSPDQSEKPNKKTTTVMNWMDKLKAAFGLGDDSDEADVLLSAKELKADKSQLKAEKEGLEEELEAVKQENKELKEKLDEQEAEQEEQQEEEFEAELEAAVDDFKIKAGRKDELKAEFEGDLAGLKRLLKNIPEGAVKASGGGEVEDPKKKKVPVRMAASGSIADKVRADHGLK